MYLRIHNNFSVGWVIIATAPELCQNVIFFLNKRLKEFFAYVLELMLTFDKMQNTGSPLMYTKFEIWGQIVLYVGCSGPVVECLNKINMLLSTITGLEQPIYRTMYTVWNAWITFKMLCPQISNWVLSEIQAYWYIILHAYMWVRGIYTLKLKKYARNVIKESSPKPFKLLKIVLLRGTSPPWTPYQSFALDPQGLRRPPWPLAKVGAPPKDQCLDPALNNTMNSF